MRRIATLVSESPLKLKKIALWLLAALVVVGSAGWFSLD
jgi:hypothetical protein